MTSPATIIDQIEHLLGSVSANEAQGHIERLEREIEAKQAERRQWVALLGLKNQQLDGAESTNGNHASQDTLPLRRAVLVIFKERVEGSTLVIGDLRDELQRRGWLGDGEKDMSRLYMTVSNMVKRKDLFRPERGLYQLPPKQEES
jgi:hypothetical protein